MISIFCKGFDLFCIALPACKHEDVQVSTFCGLATWNFVHNGEGSFGMIDIDLLILEFLFRLDYLQIFRWNLLWLDWTEFL